VTTPWSPARIAAVAPDPSSLTAARGLAGRWSATGRSDRALWGLCRGSGSKPYTTTVDLDGPAYRCSCPSRKFPCKHALSLLSVWSTATVEETDEPDFVVEWLAGRAEKAAAIAEATTAAEPARTPDPATARRRAERVSAGLDDLDRWLGDRIRAGLGSVPHNRDAYDDIAARMVDAQTPGVASTLRSLPSIVATDPDWPARILAEYGRLHLLVRAYRAADTLPEPLVRSVHTHLGLPTRADEVRALPAVRDEWHVLAVRTTEDGRVFTRRTWLRGRTTRRWATLLEFAHGSARFEDAAPLVGTIVDADLHFYPAAAPLRALLGARHRPPLPLGSPPGTDLDTALDEYADALAADPWIRTWPALLAAVVPTVGDDGWFLVDRDGRALPLGGESDTRWRLLAASGGRPVTVCGDWDGHTVTAVSVFTDDEEVAL